MHEDDMIGRIAGLYRAESLHVPLAQVRRRARRRRRNFRIATAGVVVLAVLLAGTAVYAIQARRDRTQDPAAVLTTTCANRYRALAAAHPDRDHIPSILPSLVIALTDGPAAFRVYANPTGRAASTYWQFVFACGRSRTGKITADLTVAPDAGFASPAFPWGDSNPGLGYYHEFLPDGSGVIVGEYAVGTIRRVTVTSPLTGHVLTAVNGQVFVAWSTTDDLSGAEISIEDSAGTVTAGQPTAVSGSYNPADLAEFCQLVLAENGDPREDTNLTAFRLTRSLAGLDPHTVIEWLYPYRGGLIGCEWSDYFTGTQRQGPVRAILRSGRATPVLLIGSAASSGQPGWVAGTVPPDTQSVQIIEGGQTIQAQFNEGYFVAWVPDTIGDMAIVTTTTTEVYTSVNGVTTRTGR